MAGHLPIRVLAELGIRGLFLSNAAGVIHTDWSPGELMLIRDHLNLMAGIPWSARVPGDPRFPDLTEAWDPALCEAARSARATGSRCARGLRGGSGAELRDPG